MEDNIKLDLGEVECYVMWIHMAQDNNQWNANVNSNEPFSFIKCGEFLDQLSDSWLLKKESVP
jgi:hypothetical protein